MQKDEERINNVDVHLSIYFKTNCVMIYYETLKALGKPKRISFMLDKEARTLLVTTHDGLDCLSHVVPKNSYVINEGMYLRSMKLCRIILFHNQFNSELSYRFSGKVYKSQGVVKFDLSSGEEIQHKN